MFLNPNSEEIWFKCIQFIKDRSIAAANFTKKKIKTLGTQLHSEILQNSFHIPFGSYGSKDIL